MGTAQSPKSVLIWLSADCTQHRPACVHLCGVQEPMGARTGREKRASAAARRPRGPMSLFSVGMRWRLATCGRSHVSACRAEQASSSPPVKSCSTPTLLHRNPLHPHRASHSCACLHVRHARSPYQSNQHPRGHCDASAAISGHASSALRADDHFHGQPTVLFKSPESVCHSLPCCIGSCRLASSVRNISDLPSPLGLTHMG